MTEPVPLIARLYNEAVFTPTQGEHETGFRFGGFLPDGQPLEGIPIVRWWGTSAQATFEPSVRSIDRPGNYGGVLSGHFGHFLIESLARLWWLRRTTTEPIIWHDDRTAPFNSWQRAIFQIAGLSTDRMIVITEPVSVRNIIVPEAGYQCGLTFHQAQVEALELVQFHKPKAGRRVWFSRSALPAQLERVSNEIAIETALTALNWEIVHPETLSVPEQLAVIGDAETIAGFEGSAFHLLILAKECQADIRIIARKQLHPAYRLIAKAKGLRQKELLSATTLRVEPNGNQDLSISSTKDIIDFVHS